MFISPALEELSEPEQVSGTDTLRAVPSSAHDPLSVVKFPADMTGSSDMDGFKRDLTRQLVGVDQKTFERVKQAIRSALDSPSASADPSSVIQVNQNRIQTAHADQQCHSKTLRAGVIRLTTYYCRVSLLPKHLHIVTYVYPTSHIMPAECSAPSP